jgi:hypothetical protein
MGRELNVRFQPKPAHRYQELALNSLATQSQSLPSINDSVRFQYESLNGFRD